MKQLIRRLSPKRQGGPLDGRGPVDKRIGTPSAGVGDDREGCTRAQLSASGLSSPPEESASGFGSHGVWDEITVMDSRPAQTPNDANMHAGGDTAEQPAVLAERGNEPETTAYDETAPLLAGSSSGTPSATFRVQPQLRSFCTRFSFVILILVLVLVGTALIMYHFILPRSVQSMLDQTALFVDTVNLTRPSHDGRALHIRVLGGILTKKPSWLIPDMEACTESTLLTAVDENLTPLGTFSMPSMQLNTGSRGPQPFEVDSKFAVLNQQALATFSRRLIDADEVSWVVRGELSIILMGGALKIRSVELQKSLPLKGMGGLKDITLVGFDLPGDSPEGGIILTSAATMRNPSNVGMGLVERLRFAIDLPDGIRLALLKTRDPVTIPPRAETTLKLHGRLIPHWNSPERLRTVSKFFSAAVTGRSSSVVVRCLGTESRRPHWLDRALASLSVAMDVPPQPKMDLVESLEIVSLGMEFTPAAAYSPITTGLVRVGIMPPFGFPLQVLSLAQSLRFLDLPDGESLEPLGPAFAELHTGFTDVISQFSSHDDNTQYQELVGRQPMVIDVRLPRTQLQVYQGREAVFARFMRAAFDRDSKRLLVRGDTAARVNTSIGMLSLEGVKLEQAVILDGMAGLRRLPANISVMDVTGSEPGAILVHSELDLYSPASVSASLGLVTLDLFYCFEEQGAQTGAKVGFVKGADMRVRKGWTKVKVEGRVLGSQKRREEFSGRHDPLRKFLGRYTSGLPVNLTVRGSESSTDIPSLVPLLAGFSLEQTVPPMPEGLITDVKYHVFSESSSFVLNNTLQLPIALLALRANATFRGHRVGTFHVDLRDTFARDRDAANQSEVDDIFEGNADAILKHKYDGDAFVVPASSARASPHWKVSLPIFGTGYGLIKEVLATGGSLTLDLSVRCYVGVGEWRGWMEGEWKGIKSLVVLDR